MKNRLFPAISISLIALAPLVLAQPSPHSRSMTCSLFSTIDMKKSVEIQVDEDANILEAANLVIDEEHSEFRLKVTLLNGDLDMNLENKKTDVTVTSVTDTRLEKRPKLSIKNGTQKIAAMASCWIDENKKPSQVTKL